MYLKDLAAEFKIANPKKLDGLPLYNLIRNSYIEVFKRDYSGFFQSPSISPSTDYQRGGKQNNFEFSVYQRADYYPFSVEKKYNSYFPKIGLIKPQSIFLNSGMAAISCLSNYLLGNNKVSKLVLGENAYYETKWLFEGCNKMVFTNEYDLENIPRLNAFWFEYPINCTNPGEFPFQEQLDLKKIFETIKEISRSRKSLIYLVIDFTLFTIPFNVSEFVSELPSNLVVFLVTSLQKHRGLGLDLTNAGAITIYANQTENVVKDLIKLRAITGSSITQETIWLMPQIKPSVVNTLIKDSGNEAWRLYNEINRPNLPVKFYFSNNSKFRTSFIFIEICSDLMIYSKSAPYLSDLLLNEIVVASKKRGVVLIHGTSFGFPFSRIFKNSERYANTSTLRLAVGYDSSFNKNLGISITEGVDNFINKTKLLRSG